MAARVAIMEHLEAIAEPLLADVAGGIDWNQVGMQALYGGAAGAGIGSTTGIGTVPGLIGGAAIGGGLAMWSTWNQTTMKPAK